MSEKPDQTPSSPTPKTSRRRFIQNSSLLLAGGAVAGGLNIAQAAHSFGSDVIKIGLIGCGGRGAGAADQAMNTQGGTKLVAMADAFPDRLQAAYRSLNSRHRDKVDVPKDRQFSGFDAYKQVLETDCDLVILATPPGFRPLHFAAAVKAGKHVFAEKPVAVDAAGVRKFLEASKEAKEKDLAVAIGLQRRHEEAYRETIKRLQEGAIGDVIATRVYWNGDGVWVRPRQEGQTEMEYQMRNWYYFNWLCGDHINEQHIHNIDVSNWLLNGYPTQANGMGGRQVRTGPEFGEIYDHHFVEFTYENGTKMFSQCRHIKNCWNTVDEYAHGTKGHANIGGAKIYDAKGETVWSYGGGGRDGHQQEHHNLFRDLRDGVRPQEGEYGAMSTMTAILGRMATYSGKVISMKEALASELVLSPVENYHSFSDTPPVLPKEDGSYGIPTPGQTKVL